MLFGKVILMTGAFCSYYDVTDGWLGGVNKERTVVLWRKNQNGTQFVVLRSCSVVSLKWRHFRDNRNSSQIVNTS